MPEAGINRPGDLERRQRVQYDLAADNFPSFNASVHGFWSVTLYDSTYNLVPGSENYSVNGYYPEFQVKDAEGGLTIVIQSTDPGNLPAGSYWLQPPEKSDSSSDTSFF